MSTLGTLGLLASFLLLIIAFGCSMMSSPKRRGYLFLSKIFYYAGGTLVFWCVILLMCGFFLNDVSLRYVVEHSSRTTAWYYRLSGLWAGREGSSLLWVLLTLGMTTLASGGIQSVDISRLRRFYLASSLIGSTLMGITMYSANPFVPIGSPVADGYGLNAMLQDWAMVIHPPLLFAGYACIAVVFILACCDTGNMDGEGNAVVAEKLARWARLAGGVMTAGIVTGAMWAYDELGWGGYWGWDPVENASLLPWIMTMILIHFARPSACRVSRWVMILSGGAFASTLVAAWLTRSGVVFSLHAFADESPMWMFLGAIGAVILYTLIRGFRLAGGETGESLSLVAGGLILFLMAAAVLAGTLWPVWGKLIVAEPKSMTGEFYNSVMGLMGLGLLAVLGWCSFGRIEKKQRLEWGRNAFTIGSLAGFGYWLFHETESTLILIAVFLITGNATLILADMIVYRKSFLFRLPRNISHVGLLILSAGLAFSMVQKPTSPILINRGESHIINGLNVTLQDLDVEEMMSDSPVVRAKLKIGTKQGEVILQPKQILTATGEQRSDPAYHTGLFRDIYAVLEDFTSSQAMVSVRVNPLVSWVWAGTAILIAGCFLSAKKSGKCNNE
jgi:cytochrome c-type biogenesis protein CcmF